MTGNVLITKWGLFKFMPILSFYVEWDVIQRTINTENYLFSIGLFKLLPKMFKSSYVIMSKNEITSLHTVKKLIQKLEEKEGEELSDEKKEEILDKAKQIISTDADQEETISESFVVNLQA